MMDRVAMVFGFVLCVGVVLLCLAAFSFGISTAADNCQYYGKFMNDGKFYICQLESRD